MKIWRGLGIGCLALSAVSALAWNDLGHMLVAEIAYRELKEDHPQVWAKVEGILRHLPKTRRSSENPADTHDLFLFASTYPDLVRSGTSPERSQHKKEAHYINYLFKADGTPAGVKRQTVDIVKRLKDYRRNFFEGTQIDQARKLAWIEHLIGDIHQPLHCAARITGALPGGDLGGNLFYLEIPEYEGRKVVNSPLNLHSYWDQTLSRFYKRNRGESIYAQTVRVASLVRQDYTGPLGSMKSLSFTAWAKEGYEWTRANAYPTSLTPEELPDAEYQNMMIVACRKKVLLAGHRLADALVKIVGE